MLTAQLRRIASARPAASYITRLTATSTFAYLVALLIPAGTNRPVLAPLTALLVLQASLYQTMRSAFRKVASVAVGVLGAVAVAEFVGFSWWLLTLVIAGALLIGRVLRLGDDLLEVPISAMLIFSSVGPHAAATGRIVDTLVGTGAGLAGGLVFSHPQVRPARSAVGQLAGKLAGLLGQMGRDLARDTVLPFEDTAAPHEDMVSADELAAVATQWLIKTRVLRDEIEQVDDTLRKAADSARLNPRALVAGTAPVSATTVALRGGLEALEHFALTLRGLARSVLDSAVIASEASPVRDRETRERLASVLDKLGDAIGIYGRLLETVPAPGEPADSAALESELAAALEDAHRRQDELATLLEPRPGAGQEPSEWPLRGTLLTHVDRLRTGLRTDVMAPARRPAGHRRRPRARAGRGSRTVARSAARLRPPTRLLRRPVRLPSVALPRFTQPSAGSRSRSSAQSER